MQVVSGTLDISNGTGGGTVSSVSTLIAHSDYIESKNENNIALLKVSILLPICLLIRSYSHALILLSNFFIVTKTPA
jgi:hypothetical protein